MDNLEYTPNREIPLGENLPAGIARWALVVEYLGTGFQGFQRQPSAKRTVQGELEKALSSIANHSVTLICAGRTDAGVHANHQVVHFDTSAVRLSSAWVDGVNTRLPDDIRVKSAHAVSAQFHARFSALARRYHYLVHITHYRSVFLNDRVNWCRKDLNTDAMQQAAQYLIGEQNFTSFRSSQCQAHSPMRRMESIQFIRGGDFVLMDIKGNAFLHHMVRNIFGSLAQVGLGHKPVEWIKTLRDAHNRTLAAPTAPAQGLYFVGVDYPAEFNLPPHTLNTLNFFGRVGATE